MTTARSDGRWAQKLLRVELGSKVKININSKYTAAGAKFKIWPIRHWGGEAHPNP